MHAATMSMAKSFTAKRPRTYITTKNVTIWLILANSELAQDKEATQTTEMKGESLFGLFLHSKIRIQWEKTTGFLTNV